MKPHVICHMVASLDGRTLTSRWRPEDPGRRVVFERLHERLAVNAWLVGRITGQEYAKRDAYPDDTDQRYPREPWFARRDATACGIVLDAHGKIAWGRSDIGGDPIVVVLTETVSDAHLAGLREDGVSYIFAGAQELDLGRGVGYPQSRARHQASGGERRRSQPTVHFFASGSSTRSAWPYSRPWTAQKARRVASMLPMRMAAWHNGSAR